MLDIITRIIQQAKQSNPNQPITENFLSRVYDFFIRFDPSRKQKILFTVDFENLTIQDLLRDKSRKNKLHFCFELVFSHDNRVSLNLVDFFKLSDENQMQGASVQLVTMPYQELPNKKFFIEKMRDILREKNEKKRKFAALSEDRDADDDGNETEHKSKRPHVAASKPVSKKEKTVKRKRDDLSDIDDKEQGAPLKKMSLAGVKNPTKERDFFYDEDKNIFFLTPKDGESIQKISQNLRIFLSRRSDTVPPEQQLTASTVNGFVQLLPRNRKNYLNKAQMQKCLEAYGMNSTIKDMPAPDIFFEGMKRIPVNQRPIYFDPQRSMAYALVNGEKGETSTGIRNSYYKYMQNNLQSDRYLLTIKNRGNLVVFTKPGSEKDIRISEADLVMGLKNYKLCLKEYRPLTPKDEGLRIQRTNEFYQVAYDPSLKRAFIIPPNGETVEYTLDKLARYLAGVYKEKAEALAGNFPLLSAKIQFPQVILFLKKDSGGGAAAALDYDEDQIEEADLKKALSLYGFIHPLTVAELGSYAVSSRYEKKGTYLEIANFACSFDPESGEVFFDCSSSLEAKNLKRIVSRKLDSEGDKTYQIFINGGTRVYIHKIASRIHEQEMPDLLKKFGLKPGSYTLKNDPRKDTSRNINFLSRQVFFDPNSETLYFLPEKTEEPEFLGQENAAANFRKRLDPSLYKHQKILKNGDFHLCFYTTPKTSETAVCLRKLTGNSSMEKDFSCAWVAAMGFNNPLQIRPFRDSKDFLLKQFSLPLIINYDSQLEIATVVLTNPAASPFFVKYFNALSVCLQKSAEELPPLLLAVSGALLGAVNFVPNEQQCQGKNNISLEYLQKALVFLHDAGFRSQLVHTGGESDFLSSLGISLIDLGMDFGVQDMLPLDEELSSFGSLPVPEAPATAAPVITEGIAASSFSVPKKNSALVNAMLACGIHKQPPLSVPVDCPLIHGEDEDEVDSDRSTFIKK